MSEMVPHVAMAQMELQTYLDFPMGSAIGNPISLKAAVGPV